MSTYKKSGTLTKGQRTGRIPVSSRGVIVMKPKKGKGSYSRKAKHRGQYDHGASGLFRESHLRVSGEYAWKEYTSTAVDAAQSQFAQATAHKIPRLLS